MMKVALTGNVASGKSEVARLWAREGVPLVSADDLARKAVRPGTPGLRAVVALFGSQILREDGTLDRDRLRGMVFGDPALRRGLEDILHPMIRSLRDAWMEDEEEKGSHLAVAEIPLLFEAGLQDDYDVVVLVDASSDERLRRLTDIRGLEEGEARKIMDVQMPSGEKVSRANFVIHNHGTMRELEIRALALLDLLRARAATGRRER
jgi:dephospho-CoA kinase